MPSGGGNVDDGPKIIRLAVSTKPADGQSVCASHSDTLRMAG